MEWLLDPQIWLSFLTLSMLEIVLGIDNIVFIALLVNKLPKDQQKKARTLGLMLALVMRIGLLLTLTWVMQMNEPILEVFGYGFSGKDLLMLAGGFFLIYKATHSIHDEVTGDEPTREITPAKYMQLAIMQIVVIDLIFSFDSVMTAVGLTQNVPVIVAAMFVAMIVMIVASGFIAEFLERYPTLKVLALSFIMLVGMFLVAEGMGLHFPKGYIYAAMAFSLGVETLNLTAQRKRNARADKSKKDGA